MLSQHVQPSQALILVRLLLLLIIIIIIIIIIRMKIMILMIVHWGLIMMIMHYLEVDIDVVRSFDLLRCSDIAKVYALRTPINVQSYHFYKMHENRFSY